MMPCIYLCSRGCSVSIQWQIWHHCSHESCHDLGYIISESRISQKSPKCQAPISLTFILASFCMCWIIVIFRHLARNNHTIWYCTSLLHVDVMYAFMFKELFCVSPMTNLTSLLSWVMSWSCPKAKLISRQEITPTLFPVKINLIYQREREKEKKANLKQSQIRKYFEDCIPKILDYKTKLQ